MSYGYPDYSRLARGGNYQLYGIAGTPPVNTSLYKGYVGLWPYVDIFANINPSSDYAQIEIDYYSDINFTDIIGTCLAVRAGSMYSSTQYANQSDWADIYYNTKSGNAMAMGQFNVYASNGRATSLQLGKSQSPLFYFTGDISGPSSATQYCALVQVGPGLLSWSTSATTWEIYIQYYDYVNAAWLYTQFITSKESAQSGTQQLAMMDAPYRFIITNSDTSGSASFTVSWVGAG